MVLEPDDPRRISAVFGSCTTTAHSWNCYWTEISFRHCWITPDCKQFQQCRRWIECNHLPLLINAKICSWPSKQYA
jgi:hypothetical protein